jgi:ElaB/YqjD/DUF883 family membrane-anchored ribosome-binding protein
MTMITDQIAEHRPSLPDAGQVQRGLSEARSSVADLEQQARTFIRQRPIVALLAAAGVGYLVARLVSRGMRGAR